MPDKAHNLREFIETSIAHALAACTQCGRCYEACPMPAYSPVLERSEPQAVVAGVLGLLRREAPTAEALEWTRICAQTGSCVSACPEGVNPMLMLRTARMVALGSLGDPPRLQSREEPHFFRKIDGFAALQLNDDELVAWHDRRLP